MKCSKPHRVNEWIDNHMVSTDFYGVEVLEKYNSGADSSSITYMGLLITGVKLWIKTGTKWSEI